MTKTIGARLGLVSLMAIGATLGTAGLAARAEDSVKIMVGGLEKQIYLPFKLTEQLGFFKEAGANVELLSEPSGVGAEDEMLAGNVQGVGGFYDHCIDLQAKGKAVESVVQINQVPGEVEIVSTKHPELKGFADMKGKNLGVTGLGSSTNFLTQYLATKAGVPVGTFTSVAVGAGDTFIKAMQDDNIQAGMTTEPTISRLIKSGVGTVMVDMRTMDGTKAALGGIYPATSLYMQTAWVDAHKEQVQKIANALVKTLKWIQAHSSAEIADKMPKDYLVGDRDGYIKALDGGRGMYSADGVMPASGPETVLAVLGGFSKNVKGKTIDLMKTFTTEFVKNAK